MENIQIKFIKIYLKKFIHIILIIDKKNIFPYINNNKNKMVKVAGLKKTYKKKVVKKTKAPFTA